MEQIHPSKLRIYLKVDARSQINPVLFPSAVNDLSRNVTGKGGYFSTVCLIL